MVQTKRFVIWYTNNIWEKPIWNIADKKPDIWKLYEFPTWGECIQKMNDLIEEDESFIEKILRRIIGKRNLI